MTLPAYNLQGQSDEALIKACEGGLESGDAAFQELMRRYIEPIYNFVRQYTRNNEDAEDITQDTFFKTWKNLGRFEENKKFKPWLYTIARNTALDYVKKKRVTHFSELDDDENDLSFAETLADEEPAPDELFQRSEVSEELFNLMSDLHPDHRGVIIMHYHQDMTFEEIAEAVGKPMNTVKSWHRRALMKIREKLVHHNPFSNRNQ